MKQLVLTCVAVSVLVAGCGGGPETFSSVAGVAAALEDEGIDCRSVEPARSGDLVAEQGTCDGHDLYVFDDEGDRDRWLAVGEGFGDVVVGPNWAIVPDDRAQDIADALRAEVR
jgi:hypothetical protein